jgi:hypothetical protein
MWLMTGKNISVREFVEWSEQQMCVIDFVAALKECDRVLVEVN